MNKCDKYSKLKREYGKNYEGNLRSKKEYEKNKSEKSPDPKIENCKKMQKKEQNMFK